MALPASKVSGCPAISKKTSASASYGVLPSFIKAPRSPCERVELMQLNVGHFVKTKYSLYNGNSWHTCGKHMYLVEPHGSSLLCFSSRTRNSGTKEHVRNYGNCSDISSAQAEHVENVEGDDQITPVRIVNPTQGLAEAYKFAYNDAKIMNERARNDIVLLSRGIMRLDARARQDVAILGSGFLKLDARAREDTKKIDRKMKSKAERLHHIASIIKDKAHSRLKSAADKHWSDGALEADLRRADYHAKRRAVEDTLMALEFVINVHDMMVNRLYNWKIVPPMENDMTHHFTLEKNGETLDLFFGEVSVDRISAIEEAYWNMASALSEADGIDYTDPEELELLVKTLIDLDAMDGKSSVSLLAECSSSPDVNTRQALANALAAAPSMWTLGNAGMGALQRLAEDSNLAISAAASKALYELKKQWEIEEGDSWRLMMNQKLDNSEEDNRS